MFNDDKCLDVPVMEEGAFVESYPCHGLKGNQEWKHDKAVVLSVCLYLCARVYVSVESVVEVTQKGKHSQAKVFVVCVCVCVCVCLYVAYVKREEVGVHIVVCV